MKKITRTICLGMALLVLGSSMPGQAYDTPEAAAKRVTCKACENRCIASFGSGIAFNICRDKCWNSSECK